MDWKNYLKNKFKNDFFVPHEKCLTKAMGGHFASIALTDASVNAIRYTNVFCYYGYKNKPDMVKRYNQIPKEYGIPDFVWVECMSAMNNLSPHHLHMVYEKLTDVFFVEEIAKSVMKKKNFDWNQAIEYINASALYEVFTECDDHFVYHYDENYWADYVISSNEVQPDEISTKQKDINLSQYTILTNAIYTEDPDIVFGVYQDITDPNRVLLLEMNTILKSGFEPISTFPAETTARDFKTQTLYRHYKNKDYKTLYRATHAVTGEEFAVYLALYDNFKVWARPLQMFLDELPNENGYRFTEIK